MIMAGGGWEQLVFAVAVALMTGGLIDGRRGMLSCGVFLVVVAVLTMLAAWSLLSLGFVSSL